METKTFLTPEEALHNADSSVNQSIKQKFVSREVYCNVNTMVEYILSQSYESSQVPFSWDDIENGYEYNEVDLNDGCFLPENKDELDEKKEEIEDSIKELEERMSILDEKDRDEWSPSDEEEYDLMDAKIYKLKDDRDTLDDIETTPQEIFEWWTVSDYLFDKLKDYGYPVVDAGSCYVWGRCTSGQAILLDYVISKICADMEILEGQRNSWKD